jgi:hypothetical protein
MQTRVLRISSGTVIINLLRVPLARALPAFFLESAFTLGPGWEKFCAVGMDELTEKHSFGTGVCWIAGDSHPLAGFDGLFSPANIGEIQPSGEFDSPLRDFTRGIGYIHKHHGVWVDEFELRYDAGHRDNALVVVYR